MHGGGIVARAQAVPKVQLMGFFDLRHVQRHAQARLPGRSDPAIDDLQRRLGQALAVLWAGQWKLHSALVLFTRPP